MTLQAPSHNVMPNQTLPIPSESGSLPASEPIDLHAALNEVRQMQEFRPPEPNPLDAWLEQPFFQDLMEKINQAWTHLQNSLARIISKVHLSGNYHLPQVVKDVFSGFVGLILILVGLFALYVMLGWLLRLVERMTQTKKPENRVFDNTLLMDSAYHAKHAQRYAQAGNYTEGIRQWYLALLCLLDETKVAPFSKTRSNREYRELITAEHADWSAWFGHVAHRFEAVRYGKLPGEQRYFQECRQWYEQLDTELKQGQVSVHG